MNNNQPKKVKIIIGCEIVLRKIGAKTMKGDISLAKFDFKEPIWLKKGYLVCLNAKIAEAEKVDA